jgi:hypothetical protein
MLGTRDLDNLICPGEVASLDGNLEHGWTIFDGFIFSDREHKAWIVAPSGRPAKICPLLMSALKDRQAYPT